ncbi:MAG: LytTR family DNA-binding domain-containing protein [Hyphomonadaceae bacterium]|nr:LytTR family DNA-binding domain-containing protein [Hyphomonadaceae bacterium]
MRIILAEDEPLAARRLERELLQISDCDIVGTYADGVSARAAILELRPDVAFLDIEMPGCTGLELLNGIPEQRIPLIVFTTAYHEHALEALKAGAIDYLLKPIDSEAVREAVAKAAKRLKEAGDARRSQRLSSLIGSLEAQKLDRRKYETEFWVRGHRGTVRVAVDSIEAIEAARDYVNLHQESRSHLLRGKISNIAEKLDPECFLRVHRSFIVHTKFIQAVLKPSNGVRKILMASGRKIPIGRSFNSEVMERITS